MNISLNRDMSTTTPIKKRGKKALYLWNGKDTSITELLTEPDVREFVSQGSTILMRRNVVDFANFSRTVR